MATNVTQLQQLPGSGLLHSKFQILEGANRMDLAWSDAHSWTSQLWPRGQVHMPQTWLLEAKRVHGEGVREGTGH